MSALLSCHCCRKPILAGQPIRLTRLNGERVRRWAHGDCQPTPQEAWVDQPGQDQADDQAHGSCEFCPAQGGRCIVCGFPEPPAFPHRNGVPNR
jgi:hypothetical protein